MTVVDAGIVSGSRFITSSTRMPSSRSVTRAVTAALRAEPAAGVRYLLPDVALSGGVFLDGAAPADLPRPVEVIGTGGDALVEALQ